MHFLINNSNLQGTYLNWYHFLLDYHRTFGNTNFLHISKYVNKLLAMFIEQVYLQINSKPLAHLQFYTSKTPLRFPFSLEILYVRFINIDRGATLLFLGDQYVRFSIIVQGSQIVLTYLVPFNDFKSFVDLSNPSILQIVKIQICFQIIINLVLILGRPLIP